MSVLFIRIQKSSKTCQFLLCLRANCCHRRESGSGKSTLIRAAIGLLPAGGELASGQILFGEKDMAAMTAEELRHVRGEGMAMIFRMPVII